MANFYNEFLIMKQNLKLTTLLILTIGLFGSWTQKPVDNCQILRRGTFRYGDNSQDIIIKINGTKHIEYHQNGKYVIESAIKWVSDCEYNMTMNKITIPDFPYGPGDVMNVKIERVTDREIFYTSTVKGTSWKGKMIKIKDK